MIYLKILLAIYFIINMLITFSAIKSDYKYYKHDFKYYLAIIIWIVAIIPASVYVYLKEKNKN